MNFNLLQIAFIFIFLLSCKSEVSLNTSNQSTEKIDFQPKEAIYDFENPKKLQLSSDLMEVSGLAFDKNEILTHNDEEGILFKINPKNGETVEEIKFGKNDDYEGIALINETVVFVNSSGDLTFFNPETQETKFIKTELKQHNNVEGLTFIPKSNALLLACKGQPLTGDQKNKTKAIYTFDLSLEKLNTTPFLEVTDEVLLQHLEQQLKDTEISKKQKKKLQNRIQDFSPSGIEMHPATNDIYIVSAKGESLVVFKPNKEIKDIIFLDRDKFPQAEGICFDAEDNLFISTEMKGTGGRIWKFNSAQ